MTFTRNWLRAVPPILLSLDWAYVIATRPTFDDRSQFAPSVFWPQVVIFLVILGLSALSEPGMLNKKNLSLVGIGVVLDLAIGAMFFNVNLGVYLDTVGTVLVAAILGAQFGALTSMLSQGILLIFYPSVIPFYMINVMVGWLAGLAARYGGFANRISTAVSGLIAGALVGLIAAPLMSLGLGDDPTQLDYTPMELLRMFLGVFFGGLAHEGFISDPLDKAIIFLTVLFLAPRVARWLKIGKPLLLDA